MATLVENARRISSACSAIKDAIIRKGVTPTGNVESYADAIDAIVGENAKYFSVTNLTTTSQAFDCGFKPTKVMNIYNATSASLFSACINDNGTTRGVRTGSSGAGAVGSAVEIVITDTGFTARTTNTAFNNKKAEFIAIKE